VHLARPDLQVNAVEDLLAVTATLRPLIWSMVSVFVSIMNCYRNSPFDESAKIRFTTFIGPRMFIGITI